MTTRKEMTKINRLLEIIKANGKIDRVALVMASGMSISYFNNLKPFLLEIYKHKVEYDPMDKLFKYNDVIEVSNPAEEAGQ